MRVGDKMVLDVVVGGLEKRGKQVTPPPTTPMRCSAMASRCSWAARAPSPPSAPTGTSGLFAAGDKFAALGVNVAV